MSNIIPFQIVEMKKRLEDSNQNSGFSWANGDNVVANGNGSSHASGDSDHYRVRSELSSAPAAESNGTEKQQQHVCDLFPYLSLI